MFNKYQEAYKENQERIEESSKSINPVMIGLGRVLVLGINPDKEQLTEIIGENADKFNLNYQTTPDQYNDNKPSRPVSFWVTDVDKKVSPTIETIRLTDAPRISANENEQYYVLRTAKDGSWQMLTSRWGKDLVIGSEEEKTSSKGNIYTEKIIKQLRVGEERYYELLKLITKFPDMSQFLDAMKEEGLDFDTVYEGDYSGLHKLVDWINEEDNQKTFVGLFTAKIKDDGTVRQSFYMNTDTMFVDNYGKVTGGMSVKIQELIDEKLGRDGTELIRDQYTLEDLQEYSEEAVAKPIPDSSDSLDEWLDDV